MRVFDDADGKAEFDPCWIFGQNFWRWMATQLVHAFT